MSNNTLLQMASKEVGVSGRHELGKKDIRQPNKPYTYLKDKALRKQFFNQRNANGKASLY